MLCRLQTHLDGTTQQALLDAVADVQTMDSVADTSTSILNTMWQTHLDGT